MKKVFEAIWNGDTECRYLLFSLLKKGYRIIGWYGRNSNYIYLKRGRSKGSMPFCLYDISFNRIERR